MLLEHLSWVRVPGTRPYVFYELSHSPFLPVLQGRSSKLLRKWKHMEINVIFELLGVGI